MRSFAIWYNEVKNKSSENIEIIEDTNKENKVRLSLHINLWKNSKRLDLPTLLDIGLDVSCLKTIDVINIFVPFEIEKEDISDLGLTIKKSGDKLIGAIFNEDYSINIGGEGRANKALIKKIKTNISKQNETEAEDEIIYYLDENKPIKIIKFMDKKTNILEEKIINATIKKTRNIQKKNNDNSQFVLYCLTMDDQIKVHKQRNSETNLLEGTIISIINVKSIVYNDCLEEDREPDRYYFRVRLKLPEKVQIIKIEKDANPIESFFTEIEMIDFRVNDVRSFISNLREKFEKEQRFIIEKIHYLVLRNSQDEAIYYGGPLKSRILEEEMWNSYIEREYLNNGDLVAYHIAKKFDGVDEKNSTENSMSALIRFKYRKTTVKKMIFAFIIAVLTGIFGNIIYEILKKHLE